MADTHVVLITGANRGLGLGYLQTYASRPNTTVIAAVRDPSASSTKSTFDTVPKASGSAIVPVAIDAINPGSALKAVETLKDHGITHIDVAIANAGISKCYATVHETPADEYREHWEVNTLGPINLFTAIRPLLQASKSGPKFVVLSTVFGTIGEMDKFQFPDVAYGSSKAAMSFVIRKIHFENDWLIAFPIHPGWVATDGGNFGAKTFGMDQAPMTIQESVDGVIDKIDKATRESASGTFQTYDGNPLAW